MMALVSLIYLTLLQLNLLTHSSFAIGHILLTRHSLLFLYLC